MKYLGEVVEWDRIWEVYIVWNSERINKNKY